VCICGGDSASFKLHLIIAKLFILYIYIIFNVMNYDLLSHIS
jgi:hypothetical protein